MEKFPLRMKDNDLLIAKGANHITQCLSHSVLNICGPHLPYHQNCTKRETPHHRYAQYLHTYMNTTHTHTHTHTHIRMHARTHTNKGKDYFSYSRYVDKPF